MAAVQYYGTGRRKTSTARVFLRPGAGAISSAINLLEARAQFDAPQRAVYLRVGEHDGRIYLDLADERWRAVEIGPDGWQVITCPPIR